MQKQPLFVAISNQKGGVGKSSITIALASYIHYQTERMVAIVDCDYPQYSIVNHRNRDQDTVNNSEELKAKLVRQCENTNKKAYPILQSTPEMAVYTAMDFIDKADEDFDLVLFDLSGTVGNMGILKSLINMDYIFVPIVTDKIIMLSSMSFVVTLNKVFENEEDCPVKGIHLFWNRFNRRENDSLYRHYKKMIDSLNLKVLETCLPESTRFKKEINQETTISFRSTFFPPDRKYLKGSMIEELANEILNIIKL